MIPSHGLKSIKKQTECLLDETSTNAQLTDACLDLYDRFAHACGPDLQSSVAGEERLSTGHTLAAWNAAACLLDTHRTVAFIRGLRAAIRDARSRLHGEPLDVVYAGTGPFASLAVPLMSLLHPRDVRFSLIEANAHSVSLLERLIGTLRLTEHVSRIVHGDASRYRHPSLIHVAVTETMQRSLGNEPFVAIAQNLRRQLAPGGVLVPERVTITAAAMDAGRQKARWNGALDLEEHHPLARLLEISTSRDDPPFEGRQSAPVLVTFPDGAGRESWVALLTEIVTFGKTRLRHGQSGLTMPDILWPLSPMRARETIEFHYRISASPGIQWRRLTPLRATA